MPLITYITVCISKKLIARGVYEVRFKKPEGFTFKAGQFILFDVPLVDHPADFQTRALSIASSPDEEDLLFVIKILPGGRLGRWIEEVVTEGTEMTFKGPFGNFVLDRAQWPSPPAPPPEGEGGSGDLFFIATGAGMAPFRPMVLAAATLSPSPSPPAFAKATVGRRGGGEGRKIDILFGVRSEEDLFWVEWLEEISKKNANVFYHITLTQPSASWTGHRGRVQVVAPQIVGKDFSGKTLYVCGNPDMTTEVKKLALDVWGVDKKNLHVEGYI